MFNKKMTLVLSTTIGVMLVLVACVSAPNPTPSSSVADQKRCVRMVTNSGGLQDHSFNQSSWEGLQQAKDKYHVDVQALVSTGETDLVPNVEQAVASACSLVVTVGWELSEATSVQALSHKDVDFAIVDETVTAPNVKSIVFNTAEAAYLAGYLAAGVTKTGIVATFGGGNQPPVTLFMDGFADGIAKYNSVHATNVKLLGWDKTKQDGAFTGDFEDVNKGKTLTQGFIDQGADIILPVAGQVGEGTLAAAKERGKVSVIWVDNDGYNTVTESFRSLILTSVMKNTQTAMVELVGSVVGGSFNNSSYIGTLANKGVEIAPFHEQAANVSAELSKELDGLRANIINGSLKVESVSSPK